MKIDLSFEDDVALFAVNGRLDSYGATLLDEKAARIAENTVHTGSGSDQRNPLI